MPLPLEAAESAQTIVDVAHAAMTNEPNQMPSPSEAPETAYGDSSSLEISSDSSGSWTDPAEPGLRPEASRVDRVRQAIGLPKREENFKYGVPEIIPSLDQFPKGYPKVAAYQHCEPGWLIFRKFGWLRNHALLDLQDELQVLEEKLKEHNKYEYKRGNKDRLLSRRSDYERPNSRQLLMKQILENLEQYDDLLLRTQKVQGIEGPSRRFQNGLYNCIHVEQNIMRLGTEEQWIRRSDDLVSLSRHAEGGWLNAVVADGISLVSRGLLMTIFRTKQQKIQTGSEKTLYLVDPCRIDMLLRAIITVIASGLLLIPVIILFKLQPTTQAEMQRNGNVQLLVILAFTLLFSASCSTFTKAKKQGVFSATAAYAAVLVIFLGTASGNNSLPA